MSFTIDSKHIKIEKISGSSYPSCLDTNTNGWYIYTAGITKDGSDNVTAWADQSANGHNLTAGASRFPTYTANGISFSGDEITNGDMASATPITLYMVMNIPTSVTYSNIFYFADSVSYLAVGNVSGVLSFIYNGSGIYNVDSFTDGQDFIVRIVINGASSKVQIKNSTAHTGTLGTAATTDFNMGARDATFILKEFIMRSVADNSTDEAAIYNYLATKYSIS